MKSSSITFAAFLLLCAFCSAQTEVRSKYEKWREELGSKDYQTRAKAMVEVWESGDEALAFLEELAGDDDPEISTRAITIAQKVRLGLKPDTPQAIVDLIDDYLNEAPIGRISVLAKLQKLQAYDFILKLRRGEESATVVEKIDAMFMQSMPSIVKILLKKDQIAEAKEALGFSNRFQYMIQLGHILDVTGALDEEVARLARSDSEEDSARYLAYLRVKGDAGLLRREARRLGDRAAEVTAALAQGDHETYFEYLLGRRPVGEIGELGQRGIGLSDRHAIKWALANHRGDLEGQKKELESLEYLSKELDEPTDARLNLFRIGYGDRLIGELDEEEFLGTKISYYLSQENYAKASDLIGLPESAQFDEWLKKLSEKAGEEIKNKEQGLGLTRLIAAAEFLEARGLTGEATKCVLRIFDLARGQEDFELAFLASAMVNSAPISVLIAVSREIDEHEASPSTFFTAFFRGIDESELDEQHVWLYRTIGKIAPDMDTLQRMLHTFSCSSRHLLVPVKAHDELFEKVVAHLLEAGEAESLSGLTKFLEVLKSRNREDELRKISDLVAEKGGGNESWRALLALDSSHLAEAAELLGKCLEDPSGESVITIHQYGLALNKSGKEGGDEVLRKARLFSNGNFGELALLSQEYLRFGEVKSSQDLLRKALLRSPVLPAPGSYTGVEFILRELASGAATLGDWQEALAYREASAILTSYNGGLSSGISYLRNRFKVLVARGALAMENGDVVKAANSFSEAHQMLPRDGYLANELFPVMREVGLVELHDQLFAESARHARSVVQRYPKDDNAYNNFAWMASRANRCLDEAEGYLKTALEINPESSAYLDTMAEIYFARRDRETALKWSTRSLKNEVLGSQFSRWELHQQNQRFRSGEFPAR